MKKLSFALLILLFAGFTASAENFKVKIEGPERSYNQMRITNNTSHSDFDCKVYSLKQKDGKFIIKETLGVFHLKENGDTDSCRMDLKRNSYVGISLPEDFGEVSYIVTYQDLPFFDIVEVSISDGSIDKYGDTPVGQEF